VIIKGAIITMCEINFGVIVPCEKAKIMQQDIGEESYESYVVGDNLKFLEELWYDYNQHILDSIRDDPEKL